MKRLIVLGVLMVSGQCFAQSFETAEPFGSAVSTSLIGEAELPSMLRSAAAPADSVTLFVSAAYLNGDGVSVVALTPGVTFSKNQVDILLARINPDGPSDMRRVRLRYKRALLTDAPVNVTGLVSFQDTEDTSERLQIGFAADHTLYRGKELSSPGQITLTGNLSYVRNAPETGDTVGEALVAMAVSWSKGNVGAAIEHEFKNDINGDDLTTFAVSFGKYFKASYDTAETGLIAALYKW